MYVNPDADKPDIENPQTNDCNRFNNIVVQLQTITSSLTLSEKKRIFIDLQQGVKVTGDDLYRNLEAPVVVKLADTRKSYTENIIPHVTTKHLQFITHAQIRYHELSRLNLANAEEEADAIFTTLRDKDIKPTLDNFIKNDYIDCDQMLDCDDDSFGKYKIDLDRLIKFCESLPVKTKLPPILMIAVYKHFSKMDDATYNSKLPTIVSWMEQTNNEDDEVDFIANVQEKIKETNLKYHDSCKIDKVWEKPTDSDGDEKMKREIYIQASEILSNYTTERVIAPKVKRDVSEVQKKGIAASQQWKCNICKDLLTANFQTDHKKPLSQRGCNNGDNLQALCPNCHATKTQTEKSNRNARKNKSK
jgi:5-methylcytosine-specific restriction endonuclease McrA